ncbi:hypothetical protein A6C57_01350 [Fibrella sp. ES10-3-2-2]|nr:hypothetical protein A6C57_01350 [Fibrella sp. ES10-3-2-2]
METVEFFSQLATKIGYNTIADRSGVSRPTVGKMLSYRKQYGAKKRQPARALVLDALGDLARERAAQLRKDAENIEKHLPGLETWKQELIAQ